MLNPLPPFPSPYTHALDAYLAWHPGPTGRPTLATLMPLLNLFQRSCVCGDLATAVRVLALPLATDRPLHHWLLELDAITHHLQLTEQLVHHPQAPTLTSPERAFLLSVQADRVIYQG